MVKKKQIIKIFPFTINILLIFWGITELCHGYLQLYGILESNNILYKITGSFQNPGPYAGFLAAILPLTLWIFLNPFEINKLSKQIQTTLACLCITFSAIILPATMSRAAWLAASIGVGIILVSHYKLILRIKQYILLHSKQAVIYSIAICLILISTGAGIYHLKKNSADGRLLMWQVTTRIITEHPLTGVGLGNFAGAYGQAQAKYFAEGKATTQEEYVAGNPEYAFNEFLQITAETGIVGIIIFLLIITLAFLFAYKSKQIGIIGSLIAFLTFACFSYPFSVWQLKLYFIILLTIAILPQLYNLFPMINKKWKTYVIILILTSALFNLIYAGKKWYDKEQAITQWRVEQTYYNMKIYEGTVDNYRKLYWQLRDEPKFLFELGQCLAKTEFYEESNRILREGASLSSDPMFWNIMGKNYQAMHRYHEAEECFMYAYNMVPNRLYPLYLLANLYYASGQNEKAIDMAKRVINKQPKVMSTAISEMKAEMKEKLIR